VKFGISQAKNVPVVVVSSYFYFSGK